MSEPTFLLPLSLEEELTQEASQYRQRQESAQQQLDPVTVSRIASAADRYPTLPHDALVPMVLAGASDDDLAAMEAEQVKVLASQDSGVFARIGDVVGSVGRGLSAAGSFAYEQGVKPVARTLGVVGQASGDVVTGLPFRLGRAATSDATIGDAFAANPLAVAGSSLAQGESIGTGFFLGDQAEEERQSRLHNPDFTVGPGLEGNLGNVTALGADAVADALPGETNLFEPGTTSFNFLSGVTNFAAEIALDPLAFGLGTVSRANKAGRLISNAQRSRASLLREAAAQGPIINKFRGVAGLIDNPGGRSTLLAEDAAAWLDGDDGRRVVDWLAGARFDEVYEVMRRGAKEQGGNTIPRQLVADLADATDSEAVRDRLFRAITEDSAITRTDSFRLPKLRTTHRPSRLNTELPGRSLDVHNLDDAVETVRRFGMNAKLDDDVLNKHMDAFSRLEDGDTEGAWNAARALLDDTAAKIASEGGSADALNDSIKASARMLTRAFSDFVSDARGYFDDVMGNPVNHPLAKTRMVNGVEEPLESAHLLTEFLRRNIPLPDARDIRREVTRFDAMRNLYHTAGWQWSADKATGFMSHVWKPLQLARVAWPVRVIAEEQVRMYGADMDSFAAHPIHAFAWATGRKGAADITGREFEDAQEFWAAMSRRASGFLDDPVRRTDVTAPWVDVNKSGGDQFLDAWKRKLAQMWNDPVAKQVAIQLDNRPALYHWFWEGDGRQFRERLMEGAGDRGQRLANRTDADAYIDSVVERLQVFTGGDDELMAAVAMGRFGDAHVNAMSDKAVRRILQGKLDAAPEVVKAEYNAAYAGGKKAGWDQAVNAIFDTLMTRPTNQLSRSPAFRQFYYKNIEELLPHMDPETAKRAVEAAAVEGVTIKGAGSLDGALKSLDDADEAAKMRAVSQTKELLYDVSERKQWADITRIVFPFGDAWQEVSTRWMRIARDNPKVLRRMQQVVTNGRDSGILYRNENGEEVFAYPGGGLLGKWLLGGGGSVRFEGRAEGLNLVTAGVGPGFGPVVQWPVSLLMPDDTDWDWVRELVTPFGSDIESQQDLTPGNVANSILPAYVEKVIQGISSGGIDNRLWNNTVGDIARVMVLNGEGSLDSEEEMRDTLERAKGKARALYLIRGVLQGGLPTGPSVDFEVETPEQAEAAGKWHSLNVLAQEWRKLRDETGDEVEALSQFTDRFGMEPWFLAQPKTKSLGEGAVSKGGDAWMRDHQEFQHEFPLVAGLFAPDPNGEFDFTAYYREIAQGIREPLTAEQQAQLARGTAARMVYNNAIRAAEERGIKGNGLTQFRADIRAALDEDYGPTWDDTVLGVASGAGLNERIEQLGRAIDHGAATDSEATAGIRKYLSARSEVLDRLRARTGSASAGLSRQDAAGYRRFLRDFAEALIEDEPSFAHAWSRLLSREVEEEQ